MATTSLQEILRFLASLKTGDGGVRDLSNTEFSGPTVEYRGQQFRLTPLQAHFYAKALRQKDRPPLVQGDRTQNPIAFAQLYRHRRNAGFSHQQAVDMTNADMAPGKTDRKGRPLFNGMEQILAGFAPGGVFAVPGVENSLGGGGGTGGGGGAGNQPPGFIGPPEQIGGGTRPPGFIGPPEGEGGPPPQPIVGAFNFNAPAQQQGSPVQGGAFGGQFGLPTAGPISQGLNTNPLQRGAPGTMALPNLLKRLTPFS